MAKSSESTARKAAKRHVSQYAFYFDQHRCTGCKTCEIACKDFHHLDGELALRTIYEFAGGSWTQDSLGSWSQDVFCYHLSLSCNHCTNPICVRFCSSDAISKDKQGFVTIDPGLCVGCQACMTACPYHAPRFDEGRGITVKCDGCRERIAEGRLPVCVEACPQRALWFGPYDDVPHSKYVVSSVAPLPTSELTQPNLFIDPCTDARTHTSDAGYVVNIYEA